MSSILKPNLQYLNLFHSFTAASKINKSINIKRQQLDKINFKEKIDFFKIDVQGYEHEIIKHGEKKLALIFFYSLKSYDLVDLLMQKISKIESNDYIVQYRNLVRTI